MSQITLKETKEKEVQHLNRDSSWISASRPGIYPSWTVFDRPLILNEREFLISAIIKDKDVLLKYNVRRDEWTQCLSMPDEWITDDDHGMDESLVLQIACANNRIFCICDHYDAHAQIQKMKTLVVDIRNGAVIHETWRQIDGHEMNPSMVNVDGTMHQITNNNASASSAIHSIWSEKKFNWEPIKFSINSIALPANFMLAGDKFSLVHVPSKEFVLMIGGQSDEHTLVGVWRYRIGSRVWEEILDQHNKPFALGQNRNWGQEEFAVLSACERFVIFAPQTDFDFYQTECFKVLDIINDEQYKVWETSIQVPGYANAMTKSGGPLDSRLLAFGWIRKLIDSTFVPMAIRMLISDWISVEMIHCLKTRCPEEPDEAIHEMIPLTDILEARL